MYLRSTPRRNKDGSEVRYLQLAHNMSDPQLRRSKVQVVYNFGREDAANREALRRLVASVTRFLEPDKALAAAVEGLEFTESIFFSSRRRHTRFDCDWSSDVCSSD